LTAPTGGPDETKKPIVSVVMVVCNVERFLSEAIESILAQTLAGIEFIIVDFGSNDESKAIVSSYAAKDHRIKLHEVPHCGLPEARNAGCFLARGKYIAIMDADDISMPDRLMSQVKFMEEHPEVGLLGGAVQWFDADGVDLPESILPPGVSLDRPTENAELQLTLLKYCPFWQPSVMVRSDAFVMVGGYRAPFLQAEDHDLWLRISEHFEVANLKRVILRYRIHPHQVSLRKRKQQTLCSLAALASTASRRNGHSDPLDSAEEITPELLCKLGVSEATQQSVLANEYRGWIHNMCGAGEWSAALTAAIEMLKSSDWKYVERRALADMYLKAAQLYWKNHKFTMSIVSAGHAVVTRPKLVGRPFRLLLERMGVV
jgi:glycosyltransferase involved in cell wall biosynthesis